MSTYGLWLSTAGMQLNDHRQNVLANNMANAQTHGYKHDYAVVAQRVLASRGDAAGMPFAHPVFDGMSGGLSVKQSLSDFSQGPLEQTGGSLDVAIEGGGFFTVQAGDQVRYTRDGSFARNAAGEIVLAADGGRWRVLSEDGDPLVLESGKGAPEVSGDGTIRQDGAAVGKVGLVQPADPGQFRKVGSNMFEAGDGKVEPANGVLHGQALEGSNFDVMAGLAQMIEASRAYQFNATMVQFQDNLTGLAISRVGRLT
ncbi:MAG TPA: flagellar hook basal-body protein [Phycisphaerae bacterium]|nr:flagellar hook basal-body protein [Phycisphaerae bacterium]HNU46729.1 flagellar hook basal-body protein [Phycisphaerae bacterium]